MINNQSDHSDHLHKIVLVGESLVGKTTIINSLQDTLKSKDNVLSCAVRFVRLEQENKKLQLVFWDTKSSSDTLLKLCLRNVEIIVFVLDAQKLLSDANQIHTSEIIKCYKNFIDSYLNDSDKREDYQIALFINKMDLIGQPIDEMMDRILFQSGIRFWSFGSALNNNVQSLIDMCSKMIAQFSSKRNEIVYKWSWLQFIIRSNLDKQFFIALKQTQQTHQSKMEHHISVRIPQIEFEDENSPLWLEMEQVTKRTCFDTIEQNLGKRSNIMVTINKIPRPYGVEQSRFTILISLWFDCSCDASKPFSVPDDPSDGGEVENASNASIASNSNEETNCIIC